MARDIALNYVRTGTSVGKKAIRGRRRCELLWLMERGGWAVRVSIVMVSVFERFFSLWFPIYVSFAMR